MATPAIKMFHMRLMTPFLIRGFVSGPPLKVRCFEHRFSTGNTHLVAPEDLRIMRETKWAGHRQDSFTGNRLR